MKFTDKIIDCIENESKRQYLKQVPIVLINTANYNPPWWYWLDYLKGNLN